MKTVFKATGGRKDLVRDHSVQFEAGDHIYRSGDLGTEMYIILEGEVHLVKELPSESLTLARLEKGDFFGEMAVIESAARSANAVAHSAVTLLAINAARFDEMLRKNPEIALRMIRKYAMRLEQANALLDKLAARKIDPDSSAEYPIYRPADPAPVAVEEPAAEVEPSAPAAAPRTQSLVHPTSGRAFSFGRGDETTIGRSDPVTGIMPDIDLTAIDNDRSVSRRHAKILRRNSGFSILEEVGTINGTFVNGQRIPTGQPVPIRHGDELRVGLIDMQVVFES